MSDTTALTTPQDQVDTLISQVADENGLEISQKVGEGRVPAAVPVQAEKEREGGLEEDGKLAERLRALRVSCWALQALPALQALACNGLTSNGSEELLMIACGLGMVVRRCVSWHRFFACGSILDTRGGEISTGSVEQVIGLNKGDGG